MRRGQSTRCMLLGVSAEAMFCALDARCASPLSWPAVRPPADRCCTARPHRRRPLPTHRVAQSCERSSSWDHSLPSLSGPGNQATVSRRSSLSARAYSSPRGALSVRSASSRRLSACSLTVEEARELRFAYSDPIARRAMSRARPPRALGAAGERAPGHAGVVPLLCCCKSVGCSLG
jgi:hypothetical protein